MQQGSPTQLGNYVFTQKYCIGQGAFGKVYRGRNIQTNREVAIKQMDSTQITEQQIGRQIAILKGLKHPNIVEYQDAFQSDGYFYIVTEYCRDGDLRSMLDSSDQQDSHERQKWVLDMFWQVCEGFAYLRQFDIIHRDLKPSNILKDGKLYKIADFGLAKRQMVHRSVINQQLMGVPIYMSPQILSKNYYTYKCDIWSMGIILYQLLYEQLPWKTQDVETLFFQILNHPEPYTETVNQSKNPIFKQLFKKTLSYLEQARSSWEQLLALRSYSKPSPGKATKKKKSQKRQKLPSKIHRSVPQNDVQLLTHLHSQLCSLQGEIAPMTKNGSLDALLTAIRQFLQQGTDLQGMLRDCCFVFLRMVGDNIHLQLMQYDQLQDSRQLLILVELLHDYIFRAQHTRQPLQPSLRGKIISQFAASVISKVNTLLMSQPVT